MTDPFFDLMAERRRLVRLDSVPIGSEVMLFDGARGRVRYERFDPPGCWAWCVEVAGKLRVFSDSAEVYVLSGPSA